MVLFAVEVVIAPYRQLPFLLKQVALKILLVARHPFGRLLELEDGEGVVVGSKFVGVIDFLRIFVLEFFLQ